MRSPVGVKCSLFFRWTRFFSCRVATVATLPSALLWSVFSLGASWVFSLQPVLPPDCRPLFPSKMEALGQAINAVTGTRRLGFCSSVLFLLFLSKIAFDLCGGRHRALVAV